MDLRELKEILQILEEKEITEFELEEQGMKLRIRKAGASPNHSAGPAPPLSLVPTVIPSSLNVPGPVALAPAPASEAPAAVPTAEAQGFVTVKSPIVGTFYRSPDPGSPPFVNVSDRVRVGQVLCIIEAMKLFNEFKAEHAGVIRRILVANAEPVEYGQPLFELEPA